MNEELMKNLYDLYGGEASGGTFDEFISEFNSSEELRLNSYEILGGSSTGATMEDFLLESGFGGTTEPIAPILPQNNIDPKNLTNIVPPAVTGEGVGDGIEDPTFGLDFDDSPMSIPGNLKGIKSALELEKGKVESVKKRFNQRRDERYNELYKEYDQSDIAKGLDDKYSNIFREANDKVFGELVKTPEYTALEADLQSKVNSSTITPEDANTTLNSFITDLISNNEYLKKESAAVKEQYQIEYNKGLSMYADQDATLNDLTKRVESIFGRSEERQLSYLDAYNKLVDKSNAELKATNNITTKNSSENSKVNTFEGPYSPGKKPASVDALTNGWLNSGKTSVDYDNELSALNKDMKDKAAMLSWYDKNQQKPPAELSKSITTGISETSKKLKLLRHETLKEELFVMDPVEFGRRKIQDFNDKIDQYDNKSRGFYEQDKVALGEYAGSLIDLKESSLIVLAEKYGERYDNFAKEKEAIKLLKNAGFPIEDRTRKLQDNFSDILDDEEYKLAFNEVPNLYNKAKIDAGNLSIKYDQEDRLNTNFKREMLAEKSPVISYITRSLVAPFAYTSVIAGGVLDGLASSGFDIPFLDDAMGRIGSTLRVKGEDLLQLVPLSSKNKGQAFESAVTLPSGVRVIYNDEGEVQYLRDKQGFFYKSLNIDPAVLIAQANKMKRDNPALLERTFNGYSFTGQALDVIAAMAPTVVSSRLTMGLTSSMGLTGISGKIMNSLGMFAGSFGQAKAAAKSEALKESKLSVDDIEAYSNLQGFTIGVTELLNPLEMRLFQNGVSNSVIKGNLVNLAAGKVSAWDITKNILAQSSVGAFKEMATESLQTKLEHSVNSHYNNKKGVDFETKMSSDQWLDLVAISSGMGAIGDGISSGKGSDLGKAALEKIVMDRGLYNEYVDGVESTNPEEAAKLRASIEPLLSEVDILNFSDKVLPGAVGILYDIRSKEVKLSKISEPSFKKPIEDEIFLLREGLRNLTKNGNMSKGTITYTKNTFPTESYKVGDDIKIGNNVRVVTDVELDGDGNISKLSYNIKNKKLTQAEEDKLLRDNKMDIPQGSGGVPPSTKIMAYDFDGTLFNNKTGRLTDLGIEVKARIDAGEDIRVVTARKDTNTFEINALLGISNDKISATGDEDKKLEVLNQLGISPDNYFDADQAKLEAIRTGVKGVEGVQSDVSTESTQFNNVSKKDEKIDTSQGAGSVGVLEDAEYNDFIDKGKVSEARLDDIANKVKNQGSLSDREKEIFSGKTGEINKIIATKAEAQKVEAGSVGAGGDVETFKLVENEGGWKATTKTYKGRETGNWVYNFLDKKQKSEYDKIKAKADSYGTKENAEKSLKLLQEFENNNKDAFEKAKQAIDDLKQTEVVEEKAKADKQKVYDKTANQLSELSDLDFGKLINLIDKDVKSTLEKRFGERIERKSLFKNRISEDYHKAKKDGSNPELVKAVEESLKETPQAGSVGEGGKVEAPDSLRQPVGTSAQINTVTTTLSGGKGERTFIKQDGKWFVSKKDGTPSKVEVNKPIIVNQLENQLLKTQTEANEKQSSKESGNQEGGQGQEGRQGQEGQVGTTLAQEGEEVGAGSVTPNRPDIATMLEEIGATSKAREEQIYKFFALPAALGDKVKAREIARVTNVLWENVAREFGKRSGETASAWIKSRVAMLGRVSLDGGISNNIKNFFNDSKIKHKNLYKKYPDLDFIISRIFDVDGEPLGIKYQEVKEYSDSEFYNNNTKELFGGKELNQLSRDQLWALHYLKRSGINPKKFKNDEGLNFHIESEIRKLEDEVNKGGLHIMQEFTSDDAQALADSYGNTGNADRAMMVDAVSNERTRGEILKQTQDRQKNSFNNQLNHFREDRLPNGAQLVILEAMLKNDYRLVTEIDIDGKKGKLDTYKNYLKLQGKTDAEIDRVIKDASDKGLLTKRYDTFKRKQNTINAFHEFDFGSLEDGLATPRTTNLVNLVNSISANRVVSNGYADKSSKYKVKELSNGARLFKIPKGDLSAVDIVIEYSEATKEDMSSMPWCTNGKSKAESVISNGDVYYVLDKNNKAIIQVTYNSDGSLEQLGGIGDRQSIRLSDSSYVNEIGNTVPGLESEFNRIKRDKLLYQIVTNGYEISDSLTKEDVKWLLFKAEKGDKYNSETTDYKNFINNIPLSFVATVFDTALEKVARSLDKNAVTAEIILGSHDTKEYNKNLKIVIGDFTILKSETILDFPNLQSIGGNLSVRKDATVGDLISLQSIGGNLYVFGSATLGDLSALQSIGGDLKVNEGVTLGDLSALQSIGGNLYVDGSATVGDLISLQSIGGDLNVNAGATLGDLISLQSIGGDLYVVANVTLGDLSALQSIGGNLYVDGSATVGDLSALQSIGANLLVYKGATLGDLSALQSIGGDLTSYQDATVGDLSSLQSIGGNLYVFGSATLGDLSALQSIGGDLKVNEGVTLGDLSALQSIGGNLTSYQDATVGDLSSLQSIGGNLTSYQDATLGDLSALQSIGGDLTSYQDATVGDLSSLQSIGGNLYVFGSATLGDLSALQSIGGDLDVSAIELSNKISEQLKANSLGNKEVYKKAHELFTASLKSGDYKTKYKDFLDRVLSGADNINFQSNGNNTPLTLQEATDRVNNNLIPELDRMIAERSDKKSIKARGITLADAARQVKDLKAIKAGLLKNMKEPKWQVDEKPKKFYQRSKNKSSIKDAFKYYYEAVFSESVRVNNAIKKGDLIKAESDESYVGFDFNSSRNDGLYYFNDVFGYDEDITDEISSTIHDNYKRAIGRTSSYVGNLYGYVRNAILFSPIKDDLSTLVGTNIADIFVVSHFSPSSLRKGVELINIASNSKMPIVMAVPEYQANQLNKAGFTELFEIPQIFNGEVVMKRVMVNDAFTLSDLSIVIDKFSDNPFISDSIDKVGLMDSYKDILKFQQEAVQFRAAAIELANNQIIIAALDAPNESSFAHEMGHSFEQDLTEDEKQTFIDEYNEKFNEKGKDWNTDVSEYFARVWEKYLSNGRKLTASEVKDTKRREKLQEVFDKFTEYLKGIYNGVIEYNNTKGVTKPIEVSPAAQVVFDRVMGIKDGAGKEGNTLKEVTTNTILESLGTTKGGIINQIKKFFTDTIKDILPDQSQRLADANFTMWEAVAKTIGKAQGIDKAIDYMRSKVAQIGVISTVEEARTMGDARFQIIGEKGAAALDAAEEATTRLVNLAVAREMEAAGKTPKEIRLATGWERVVDKEWKYEIDDSTATLNFNIDSKSKLGKKYKLESVLDYPELYKAFPKLKKIKISISKEGGSTTEGFFDGKQIVLGIDSYKLEELLKVKGTFSTFNSLSKETKAIIERDVERERYSDVLREQGVDFEDRYRLLDEKYPSALTNTEEQALIKDGLASYEEETNEIIRPYLIALGQSTKRVVTNDKYHRISFDLRQEQRNNVIESNELGNINTILKPVLLHEIQHWIQKEEGFARGGNTTLAYMNLSKEDLSKYENIEKEKTETLKRLEDSGLKWYDQSKDVRDIVQAPNDFLYIKYKSIAGEVEARNVQSRMNMSAEERRQTLLEETEDVAREDQIILQDGIEGLANAINEGSVKFSAAEKDADMAKATTEADKITLQYDDKGQHLAPNGKPSNLTESQAKIVRTPSFKNWFGDWGNSPNNASKVVDENGEPMVVAHSTNSDFTEFNAPYSGGFYFATDKNLFFPDKSKSRIISAFLNIKNPASISDRKKYLDKVGGGNPQMAARKLMEQDGFDGVIGETEVVSFIPNQVKLADGTNQTFNPNTNDIRFSADQATPQMANRIVNNAIEHLKELNKKGLEALRAEKGPKKKEDIRKTIVENNKVIAHLVKAKKDPKFSVEPYNENVEVINGFYSPLEKIIAETKADKLPVKQWADKFGKGEEAKWTGLTDWLNQQTGSLSKADIQKYLKENRIDIDIRVKGESQQKVTKQEALDIILRGEFNLVDQFGLPIISERGINRANEIFIVEGDTAIDRSNNATKFTDPEHQLGGDKERYLEALVMLPNNMGIVKEFNSKLEDYNNFVKSLGKPTNEERDKAEAMSLELNALQSRLPKDVTYQQGFAYISDKYKSSHFDEPNILVHLRMNTRTDTRGNKVLFLEEVQSDWGQKGKKEGFNFAGKFYKSKVTTKEEGNFIEIYYDGKWVDKLLTTYSTKEEIQRDIFKSAETQFNLRKKSENLGVAQAPFVTDTNAWTKLGLKVALKEAVKQGVDKIAWTTGEQQNERYDLRKQVDDIGYSYNDKSGTYRIVAGKNGSVLFNSELKESELENNLGKEVANKIILDKDNSIGVMNYLRGDDLAVGGKGMKGFYGSPTEGSLGIVGNVAKSLFNQEPKKVNIDANKTVKSTKDFDGLKESLRFEKQLKHKGKTGIVSISNEDGSYTIEWNKNKISTQHSIDITPELKAQVEKGLPKFAKDAEIYRGVAIALANGQNIVAALGLPTPTTFAHEAIFHATIEPVLEADQEAKQAFIDEYNAQFGDDVTEWTTDVSEVAARQYEKYLSNGRKLTSADVKDDKRRGALQKAFDTFTELMKELYNGIITYNNSKGVKREIVLSPAAQDFFDRITGIKDDGIKGTKESKIADNIDDDSLLPPDELLKQRLGELKDSFKDLLFGGDSNLSIVFDPQKAGELQADKFKRFVNALIDYAAAKLKYSASYSKGKFKTELENGAFGGKIDIKDEGLNYLLNAARDKNKREALDLLMGKRNLPKKYQRFIERALATAEVSQEFKDHLLNRATLAQPVKDSEIIALAEAFVNQLETKQDILEASDQLISDIGNKIGSVETDVTKASNGMWEIAALRIMEKRLNDNYGPEDAVILHQKIANTASSIGRSLRLLGVNHPELMYLQTFGKFTNTESELYDSDTFDGSGKTHRETAQEVLDIYEETVKEIKDDLKRAVAEAIANIKAAEELSRRSGTTQPTAPKSPPAPPKTNVVSDFSLRLKSKADFYLDRFKSRGGFTSGLDIDALIDFSLYLFYKSAGSIVATKKALVDKFGTKLVDDNWEKIVNSKDFKDADQDISKIKLLAAIEDAGDPSKNIGTITTNRTPAQMVVQSIKKHLQNKTKKIVAKRTVEELIEQRDLDINTLSDMRRDIEAGLFSLEGDKRAEVLAQVDDLLISLYKDKASKLAAPWVKKTVIRAQLGDGTRTINEVVDDMLDDILERDKVTGSVASEFLLRTGMSLSEAAPYIDVIKSNIDEILNKRARVKAKRVLVDSYGNNIVKLADQLELAKTVYDNLLNLLNNTTKDLVKGIKDKLPQAELVVLRDKVRELKKEVADAKDSVKAFTVRLKSSTQKLTAKSGIVKLAENISRLKRKYNEVQRKIAEKDVELKAIEKTTDVSGALRIRKEIDKLKFEAKEYMDEINSNQKELDASDTGVVVNKDSLTQKNPTIERIGEIVMNGGLSDENIFQAFSEAIGAKNFTQEQASTLRSLYHKLSTALFLIDKRDAMEEISRFIFTIKDKVAKSFAIDIIESFAYSNMLGSLKTADLAFFSGLFIFTIEELTSAGIQISKDLGNILKGDLEFRNIRLMFSSIANMKNTKFAFTNFWNVVKGKEGIELPDINLPDGSKRFDQQRLESGITLLEQLRILRDRSKNDKSLKGRNLRLVTNLYIGLTLISRGLIVADYVTTSLILPYKFHRALTDQSIKQLKEENVINPKYAEILDRLKSESGLGDVEQQLENEGFIKPSNRIVSPTTKADRKQMARGYNQRKADIIYEFLTDSGKLALIQAEDAVRRMAMTGRISGLSGLGVNAFNSVINSISRSGINSKGEDSFITMLAASILKLSTMPFSGATGRHFQFTKNTTPLGLVQLKTSEQREGSILPYKFFDEFRYYNNLKGKVEVVPATGYEKETRYALSIVPTIYMLSIFASVFDWEDDEDGYPQLVVNDDSTVYTTGYSPVMAKKLGLNNTTYEPYSIYEKDQNGEYKRVSSYKEKPWLWGLAIIGRMQEKLIFDAEKTDFKEEQNYADKDPIRGKDVYLDGIRSVMAYSTQGALSNAGGAVNAIGGLIEGKGSATSELARYGEGLVRQFVPGSAIQSEWDNLLSIINQSNRKKGASFLGGVVDRMAVMGTMVENYDFDIIGEDLIQKPYGPYAMNVATHWLEAFAHANKGVPELKYPAAREALLKYQDIDAIKYFYFAPITDDAYKATIIEVPSDLQILYDMKREAADIKGSMLESTYNPDHAVVDESTDKTYYLYDEGAKSESKIDAHGRFSGINKSGNDIVKLKYVERIIVDNYPSLESQIASFTSLKEIKEFMIKNSMHINSKGEMTTVNYLNNYNRGGMTEELIEENEGYED